MKKTVFAVVCALASGCVLAEWEEMSSAADGKATYYADASTIHKVGALVRVWTLIDYQEAQPISGERQFLSVKILEEINCQEQKSRHLNLAALTEHMGAGKVVGSEKKPADWRPMSQDPGAEATVDFACKAR